MRELRHSYKTYLPFIDRPNVRIISNSMKSKDDTYLPLLPNKRKILKKSLISLISEDLSPNDYAFLLKSLYEVATVFSFDTRILELAKFVKVPYIRTSFPLPYNYSGNWKNSLESKS